MISAKALEEESKLPAIGIALPVGAGLGFLAGLTRIGDGLFLTPLLLWKKWALIKQAAGASSLFILVHSASGLEENYASIAFLPPFVLILGACAVVGGTIGSHCGSRRFDHQLIKRLLAIALLIAGTKLIIA